MHMPASEPLGKDERTVVPSVAPIGLKRRSVILMIVFTIVTFGLYYSIWFLRRRAALNRLDSPRKLGRWPFLIFIAFSVFQFIVAVASAPGPVENTIGTGGSLLLSLAQFAVGILMLVQCFFTKDILEDHLAGPEDNLPNPLFVERVKLSGLMTFFFQIFYLQYVINRHIVGQKRPSNTA
jgi:hypothetical protein